MVSCGASAAFAVGGVRSIQPPSSPSPALAGACRLGLSEQLSKMLLVCVFLEPCGSWHLKKGEVSEWSHSFREHPVARSALLPGSN